MTNRALTWSGKWHVVNAGGASALCGAPVYRDDHPHYPPAPGADQIRGSDLCRRLQEMRPDCRGSHTRTDPRRRAGAARPMGQLGDLGRQVGHRVSRLRAAARRSPRSGGRQMTPADIPLRAIHTHQAAFLAASTTCPQCYRDRNECGGNHR